MSPQITRGAPDNAISSRSDVNYVIKASPLCYQGDGRLPGFAPSIFMYLHISLSSILSLQINSVFMQKKKIKKKRRRKTTTFLGFTLLVKYFSKLRLMEVVKVQRCLDIFWFI